MKTLFSPKRRNLIAKAFIAVFSLGLSAAIVSDVLWKTHLNIRLTLLMILFAMFLTGWMICPSKYTKGEDFEDDIV